MPPTTKGSDGADELKWLFAPSLRGVTWGNAKGKGLALSTTIPIPTGGQVGLNSKPC